MKCPHCTEEMTPERVSGDHTIYYCLDCDLEWSIAVVDQIEIPTDPSSLFERVKEAFKIEIGRKCYEPSTKETPIQTEEAGP